MRSFPALNAANTRAASMVNSKGRSCSWWRGPTRWLLDACMSCSPVMSSVDLRAPLRLHRREVQVVPEHRRRGVATALMHAVEAASRERGMNRIGLAVARDEDAAPARALYERLGYRFAHGPFIAVSRSQATRGRSTSRPCSRT